MIPTLSPLLEGRLSWIPLKPGSVISRTTVVPDSGIVPVALKFNSRTVPSDSRSKVGEPVMLTTGGSRTSSMVTVTLSRPSRTWYSSPSRSVNVKVSLPSSTSSWKTGTVIEEELSVIRKKKPPTTSLVPTMLPPVTTGPSTTVSSSGRRGLVALTSNSEIALGGPSINTTTPSSGMSPLVLRLIVISVASFS